MRGCRDPNDDQSLDAAANGRAHIITGDNGEVTVFERIRGGGWGE